MDYGPFTQDPSNSNQEVAANAHEVVGKGVLYRSEAVLLGTSALASRDH